MLPILINGRVQSISANAEIGRKTGNLLTCARYNLVVDFDDSSLSYFLRKYKAEGLMVDIAVFCGDLSCLDFQNEISLDQVGFLVLNRDVDGWHVSGAISGGDNENVFLFLKASTRADISLWIDPPEGYSPNGSLFVWSEGMINSLKVRSISFDGI